MAEVKEEELREKFEEALKILREMVEFLQKEAKWMEEAEQEVSQWLAKDPSPEQIEETIQKLEAKLAEHRDIVESEKIRLVAQNPFVIEEWFPLLGVAKKKLLEKKIWPHLRKEGKIRRYGGRWEIHRDVVREVCKEVIKNEGGD